MSDNGQMSEIKYKFCMQLTLNQYKEEKCFLIEHSLYESNQFLLQISERDFFFKESNLLWTGAMSPLKPL